MTFKIWQFNQWFWLVILWRISYTENMKGFLTIYKRYRPIHSLLINFGLARFNILNQYLKQNGACEKCIEQL